TLQRSVPVAEKARGRSRRADVGRSSRRISARKAAAHERRPSVATHRLRPRARTACGLGLGDGRASRGGSAGCGRRLALSAHRAEPMAVDRYQELCASYRWNVPSDFSIARAVCGRWAPDEGRLALLWEDEDGATARYTFHELQRQANR